MIRTLLGADHVPPGHGSLLHAPRRRGGDRRTIRAMLRRRERARHDAIHALVFAGRHAAKSRLRRITTARAKTYRLDIAQTIPPTPGQPTKAPMVIPLAFGLVGKNGGDLPLLLDGQPLDRGVIELTRPSQSFVFTGVAERPVPSLNRGFSAPVKLELPIEPDDLRFLAAHDADPFNRWQAVQTLAMIVAQSECRGVARRRACARGRRADGRARRNPERRAARTGFHRADADAAERSRHRARNRRRRRSRCDLCRAPQTARRDRRAARRGAGRHLPAHDHAGTLSAGCAERWAARAQECSASIFWR